MTIRRAVISLRVKVPVLSEQMTEVAPSVSTAGRRRITALRAAMRCTPIASVMVITAGSPSGIDADGQGDDGDQRVRPGKAAREHGKGEQQDRRDRVIQVKRRPNWLICRSSGVVSGSTARSGR